MTSISVAYFASFNSVRHKSNYVVNESLQISIGQKLSGTDQTSCFIMIFMSEGHCLSFRSPLSITNSLHHESFENWLYSIADGNSSNDFFHDDFNVGGIFSKLCSYRRRTEFSPKRVTVNLLSEVVGNWPNLAFLMISISLVHSLSFSSVRRTTNSVYYESFENCIWFRQSLLEKDQTAFFMMFSMSIGHSLSLSFLGRITSIVLYEPFALLFLIFALGALLFSDFLQSARVCTKQLFQNKISTSCHFRTGRTTFLRFSAKCTGLSETLFSAGDQRFLTRVISTFQRTWKAHNC